MESFVNPRALERTYMLHLSHRFETEIQYIIESQQLQQIIFWEIFS